ncbi:histone-lysine N-methyltransferase, H3 lysine-9 specific SUVH1-like [Punica granatum]|uniref:Uncharacterized protein n=2 Tax=Punica granatum TaxID=22663 RepID=A0A218XQU8_PUNGR|nr:histone-lysine N-methyltransferase, H3 lysine-9 specific SUVH1-like [Punica granatum]OWM87314.1 hypothetical protein CDL15_Pgr022421 [Punica granatum]PKI33891.1 hypothetical protein CRG98_045721 [Punica granatum]
MQGGSGLNSVPPASIDKTRVLDVKPLRSLKPIWPSPDQAPNYVQAPPSGPFPAGYSPFYPFASPPPASQPPAAPTPLRSFRTPEPSTAVPNGDVESSMDASRGSDSRKRSGRPLRSAQKMTSAERRSRALEIPVNHNFVSPISLVQREDGNREVVDLVMIAFDGLRRRLSQLEDSGMTPSGLAKRADLKAGNMLMTKMFRTNQRRRVGTVPGVEVGDIFFFRMELCVLGLHAPSMAGIDYLNVKGESDEDPVALSIVSSGYYDDDAGDENVLIYSGQGGGANMVEKQASDQKLERGNLALERSLRRGNEVRVIRGMRDGVNLNSKVYVYDGLYTIQESWMQKGKSGANIFKYKLVRVPGQSPAFGIWKSIEKWKEGVSTRAGLINPDLTSGAEGTPVTLVNDVDNEKAPGYFTYFPSLRYFKPYNALSSSSCKCQSSCNPGDLNCSCNQTNKGDFAYIGNGILVSRKPMLYECGPSCQCFPGCKNRVSQSGLKLRLEVFKTKDRGWGLRSWDPIRAGTFICEYAGEVIDKARLKQRLQEGEKDDYVFDTSRVYQPFKWNDPGLLERDSSDDPSAEEVYNIPSPLVISAKSFGNVARFMNHSCYPNVFWQPIIYEDNSQSYMHIAFFTLRHIPPMTELTYDYGVVTNEGDVSSNLRKRKCLCGSSKCRGFFGL